jgi:ABC-type nitrate/sulfonate/bicarbonate transport system permease component
VNSQQPLNKIRRKTKNWIPALLGTLVVLPVVLVTFGAFMQFVTSGRFPSPIEIFRAFPHLDELNFQQQVFAGAALWTTLRRVLLATLISAVCGGLFALLLSWRHWLWGTSQATIDLLRSVPVTFFVPVVVLAVGNSLACLPWLLAAIPCSLIMLLQVRQGIVGIDKARIHTFHVLAGSSGVVARLRYVIIPEIAPEFIAGMRLACSYAIVVVSVLEYFYVGSHETGFGLLVAQVAQNTPNDPKMFAGILVFGLIGLVLNKTLELIETYVTRWKYDHDHF